MTQLKKIENRIVDVTPKKITIHILSNGEPVPDDGADLRIIVRKREGYDDE